MTSDEEPLNRFAPAATRFGDWMDRRFVWILASCVTIEAAAIGAAYIFG